MFSLFGAQSEYSLHGKYFSENVVDNINDLLTDSDVVVKIDTLIDKTVDFYNSKLSFLERVPSINDEAKSLFTDESKSDIQFLLSMGLLDLESDSVTDNKNHIQLKELESSRMKQNSSTQIYVNFVNEYVEKLTTVRNISIEQEVLPENTKFHQELKTKLSMFLSKTKYFIYDIYMNHYIQFVYLLFAMNIIKTSEVYFKLNAEQQKQLAVLKKVDKLVNEYKIDKQKDLSKITQLQNNYKKLIENFQGLPKYNSATAEEVQRLRGFEGGAAVEKDFTVISTIADDLISNLLEKHKYFYEMYVATRESLPEYFNTINELVMEKIEKLKNLRNNIIQLESEDVTLLNTTQTKMPIEQIDQDTMNRPHFKEIIEELKSDVNAKVERIPQFAQGLSQSMQFQPSQQAQASMMNGMNGGFIRGSTRPVVRRSKISR